MNLACWHVEARHRLPGHRGAPRASGRGGGQDDGSIHKGPLWASGRSRRIERLTQSLTTASPVARKRVGASVGFTADSRSLENRHVRGLRCLISRHSVLTTIRGSRARAGGRPRRGAPDVVVVSEGF